LGSVVEAGIATALLTAKGYPLISIPGGVAAGVLAASVGLEGASQKLLAFGKNLGAVDLHSQALLAMLQYAKDNGHQDWQRFAEPLTNAWLKTEIAQPGGLTNDQMLRQIVYSALDSGERPYGSTAIAMLFNNANDFGSILGLKGVNASLADAKVQSAMAKILTEYAGDLAANRIMEASYKNGILNYDAQSQSIVMDFRAQTWDLGLAVSNAIAGKQDLIAGLTKGFLAIDQIAEVDLVACVVQNSDATTALPFDLRFDESALFVGDGYKDRMIGTSGNDFFFMVDEGNEIVDGRTGFNTVVYAGKKSDYTIRHEGDQYIVTALKAGTQSIDTLNHIQVIRFADQTAISQDSQITGIDVVIATNSALSDEISGLYEAVFDRLPDTQGFTAWSDYAHQYGDDRAALVRIANAFLSRSEFTAQHPNLSNEQFIDLLYSEGFNRVAESSSRTAWIKALDDGLTRAEILAEFSSSVEMVRTIGSRANGIDGFWTI
jgi:hypothetical protein